ncbi:MAG: translation initiation factor IF-3 [Planctomycetes bacterium]|nr:translation initiation factor IF-3 [Planctomycetota bacterium]
MGAQDYRRNRQIRVPEVRLIDEHGEQVGVVSTRDAQRRAEEAGLDLVEVSPTARPPVCKILDFGKFKYEARKREQKTGTKKTSSQLKELRVRPAIDKHDLSYRLDQGRKFLAAGHKVQVVCVFKGRQMRHPEHGYNVMKDVEAQLGDVAKVESQAKLMGRRMTMLLSPLSQKPGARPGGEAPPVAAKPAPAPKPASEAKPAPEVQPTAEAQPARAAKSQEA